MTSTLCVPFGERPIVRQQGFTLIEMIAALALLGVLTAVFGMGIVTAARSFTFSRENVQVAQKGQLVMTRISQELMGLIAIRMIEQRAGEDPLIIYEHAEAGARVARGYALRYRQADRTLRLYVDVNSDTLSGDGYLLAEGVTGFGLNYLEGELPWTSGDLNSISVIEIRLQLSRGDDPAHPQQFSTRVYLRKTPYLSRPESGPPRPSGLAFLIALPWLGWRKRRQRIVSPRQAGSALVVVVVSILIFAVLAAAIIPMVGSSSHQVAVTDAAAKALYLAESGFRFAESRWNPYDSEIDRHNALEELDGTYTLSGDDGQFDLRLESYFLELAGDSGASNSFQAHCPGSLPDDMDLSRIQRLRIGNQTVLVTDVRSVSGQEEDSLHITLQAPLGYYPSHTPLLLVTTVSGIANGELIYNDPQGELFPLRNGPIMIGGSNLIVFYRFNDREANRLVGLINPLDKNWTVTASIGDEVLLLPSVRLHSTGRAGSGDLRVERELVYEAPLSTADELTTRQQVTDTEGDLFSSSVGTHEVAELDGNKVLIITGTEGTDVKSSLAKLNLPAGSAVDFGLVQRGTGGYLSYDAQVKVGFYDNMATPPVLGYEKSPPVPAYYSAGPVFRLRRPSGDGYNMYGLGFMRSNSGKPDGLPDEIVPEAVRDHRAIVLWQQTGNGQHRTWLAYKRMSDLHTDFDFEAGAANWTSSAANGSWDLIDNAEAANSPSRFYRFHDWGNNSATTGTLHYQPALRLPESDSIWLSFYSKFYSAEDDGIVMQVRIRANGATARQIDTVPQTASFSRRQVDLSEFSGSQIELQFHYQDLYSNYHEAFWSIDDVRIEADWPVENSTLMVRLQEAAALNFTSGGPDAIRAGDWVIGATSGARGRVAFAPILSDIRWSEGRAAGVLQLNRVSGTFQAEELNVAGKGRRATIPEYNETLHRKVNFIKAYFGRSQSYGTTTFDGIEYGNSDRFDPVMIGTPRLPSGGKVFWPPENEGGWTPAEDRCRLIEWDALNPAVSDLAFVPWQLGGVPRNQVIIRSHDADLQSMAINGAAELGLYALGDGAANIYFDDFGLQIDVPVRSPFPAPLQP